MTASAQEGARYAANADVDPALGAATDARGRRAGDVGADRRGLRCTSAEAPTASGLTLVVVRCSGGARPARALGDLLPLEVTGRAVKEIAP